MEDNNSNIIIPIADDLKLFWRNEIAGKAWKKWKSEKDCSKKEKEQANLRTIRKYEIDLDDDHNRIKEIIEMLNKDGYVKRTVLKSIRGGHIQLPFDNLSNLDEDLRKAVRKEFIKKYGCDESKASENTLTLIENRPHHKNPDFISEVIEKIEGRNHFDEKWIEEIREKEGKNKEISQQIAKDMDFEDYFTNDPLFKYISGVNWEVMPKNCEFNNVIAKNLAIASVKNGKTKEEVDEIIKPLISKVKGYNYRSFEGWYNKAKKGELEDYNIYEINKWGEKYLRIKFYKQEWNNIQNDTSSSELEKDRIEIALPGLGRLISEFAEETGEALKDKEIIFFKPNTKDIVEITKIKKDNESDKNYVGFSMVKPSRFITLAEKYLTPGIWVFYKGIGKVFKYKSMGNELASTILVSEVFQSRLPRIDRIFTIPLPIMYKGELTFPKKGYDKRFNSWLDYDSPVIIPIPLDEAKKILNDIFEEFCFQGRQDYVNSIGGLLTPFLRGMYSAFNKRTPVFFYIANRERAGKDYLAGITGIVYEGESLEDTPISEGSKDFHSTDELRKKILSTFISGRKRLHFANNKGHINNSVLEQFITSEVFSDRILGRNELLSFDNEIEVSLSGNVGVTFTPDFANRCRFIRLFLDIEDANSRRFKKPNLHDVIKSNRSRILSALYSLIKNWIDNGSPEGKVPFTSFPEWAKICGGIMECAGYGSPCNPDTETISFSGDKQTFETKKLFELCFEKYPDQPILKKQIIDLISNENTNPDNLFGYLDFTKRSDQVKFGSLLSKSEGRYFSDIRLEIKKHKQSTLQQYLFTKIKAEKRENIFEF